MDTDMSMSIHTYKNVFLDACVWTEPRAGAANATEHGNIYIHTYGSLSHLLLSEPCMYVCMYVYM